MAMMAATSYGKWECKTRGKGKPGNEGVKPATQQATSIFFSLVFIFIFCKSVHKQPGSLISCHLLSSSILLIKILSCKLYRIIHLSCVFSWRPDRLVRDSSWWKILECVTPLSPISHVVCSEPQRRQDSWLQDSVLCEQYSDLTTLGVM